MRSSRLWCPVGALWVPEPASEAAELMAFAAFEPPRQEAAESYRRLGFLTLDSDEALAFVERSEECLEAAIAQIDQEIEQEAEAKAVDETRLARAAAGVA